MKQKGFKEIPACTIYFKKKFEIIRFCTDSAQTSFEIIGYGISTPDTGIVVNFSLILLLLLLTTECYVDLNLIPSSKLIHCSISPFSLVNSSSCSLLFSYSFGWALHRNLEHKTLLILFFPISSQMAALKQSVLMKNRISFKIWAFLFFHSHNFWWHLG